jgi:hypothetical protein
MGHGLRRSHTLRYGQSSLTVEGSPKVEDILGSCMHTGANRSAFLTPLYIRPWVPASPSPAFHNLRRAEDHGFSARAKLWSRAAGRDNYLIAPRCNHSQMSLTRWGNQALHPEVNSHLTVFMFDVNGITPEGGQPSPGPNRPPLIISVAFIRQGVRLSHSAGAAFIGATS